MRGQHQKRKNSGAGIDIRSLSRHPLPVLRMPQSGDLSDVQRSEPRIRRGCTSPLSTQSDLSELT